MNYVSIFHSQAQHSKIELINHHMVLKLAFNGKSKISRWGSYYSHNFPILIIKLIIQW